MSLNADQLAAVECDDPLLVVACPGSGKTHLVVQKMSRILKRSQYAKIVGVTFTRDGAKELQHRVQKEYGDTGGRCYVSTFHSLALNHLKRNKIKTHIASNAEVLNSVSRALDKLGITDIKPFDALGMIEACKSKSHYEPTNDQTGQIYTVYQEICKRNHIIDFYDVMRLSLDMIKDGSLPILGATHMLVDEFQDVDEVQFQYLMEHFRSGKVTTTAVGDDDQTIFGFRNALGYEGMLKYEKETNATRVTLGLNYRCHREILTPADRLILNNQNRLSKRLVANKGRGGTITKERFNKRFNEAHAVADRIQSTLDVVVRDNREHFVVKPSQWAVLARNNDMLDEIDAVLRSRGIPAYKSGTSFWEKSIPAMMLTVLRSMCKEERVGIEHLLHWSGVAANDIDELRELIGDDWIAIYDIKAMNALDLSQFEVLAKDILQEFTMRIPGLAKRAIKASPDDVIRVLRGLGDWMMTRTNKQNEHRQIELVCEILSGLNGSLLERIQIVTKKPENDNKDAGVALSTMHSSKGLEFDNVWIIGVEEKVIPSTKDNDYSVENIEEERKLMYVAMTRARNNLIISSAQPNDESFFIKEIFPS